MLGKSVAGLYKAPTMEESERLRGERYQIKFIDLRLEGKQVVSFGKGKVRQDLYIRKFLASMFASSLNIFKKII